jgi:hypothetical protein
VERVTADVVGHEAQATFVDGPLDGKRLGVPDVEGKPPRRVFGITVEEIPELHAYDIGAPPDARAYRWAGRAA